MDVKMPDGRIVKGVPDGTTKYQLIRQLINSGEYKNEDFYDAEVGKDMGSSFGEGLAASVIGTGSNLVNMALPDAITPDWASDETLRERSRLESKYGSGWFKGGKIAGDIATTMLPAGGVGMAVAKGARALQGASRVPKYLTNTLQKGLGRGAVEGATVGAILGGPDNRGSSAATFAAFGGGLGAVGTALGKTLGRGRVVKPSEAAIRTRLRTKEFIPISQAAEGGILKNIYEAFLANLPGVSGKVRGQYQHSLSDVRRYAGEHAMPDTLHAHNIARLKSTDTVQQVFSKLKRFWTTAFDDIKALDFTVLKGFELQVPKWLRTELEGTVKSGLVIPAKGQTVTGQQLQDLQTALQGVIRNLGTKDAGVARGVSNRIDALIKRNLDPTGKGKGAYAEILSKYTDAQRAYPNWMAFKRAYDSAAKQANKFTPEQLAGAAYKKGSTRGEASALQRIGQLGSESLRNFPSREGIYQTLAATGTLTTAAGLIAGSTPLALLFPAVIALGRMGASRGLQKYLMRQTKWQRLSRTMMNRHKKELQSLGFTLRQATEMLGGNKNGA